MTARVADRSDNKLVQSCVFSDSVWNDGSDNRCGVADDSNNDWWEFCHLVTACETTAVIRVWFCISQWQRLLTVFSFSDSVWNDCSDARSNGVVLQITATTIGDSFVIQWQRVKWLQWYLLLQTEVTTIGYSLAVLVSECEMTAVMPSVVLQIIATATGYSLLVLVTACEMTAVIPVRCCRFPVTTIGYSLLVLVTACELTAVIDARCCRSQWQRLDTATLCPRRGWGESSPPVSPSSPSPSSRSLQWVSLECESSQR